MKFTIEGTQYDVDLENLTLDEGEWIEDYARCPGGLREFIDALKATRVRAIRVLVLIAKRRAGEQVEWADLGNLDLMELAVSIIQDNGIDMSSAIQDSPDGEALAAFLEGKRQPKAKPRR